MRRQFARLWLLACLAATLGLPQNSKQKKQDAARSPDLQVSSMEVRREGKVILLDGTVRNTSTRPFKGIILFFEFFEPGGKMIVRKTIAVTESRVEPGEDASFEAQTPDIVRAVEYKLDAEDKDGRYLTLDKPGPNVIE
jgi:hypothetical protein